MTERKIIQPEEWRQGILPQYQEKLGESIPAVRNVMSKEPTKWVQFKTRPDGTHLYRESITGTFHGIWLEIGRLPQEASLIE